MKKSLLILACSLGSVYASAQCTTTNATSCQCQTQSSTDCDLLPDITVSWQALDVSGSGYIEYSQTSTDQTYSQGYNAGRLRVTGSTPNIGHGPLTARGVDSLGYRRFVCGTDTFSIYDPTSSQSFTCPNGDPNPHQIIFQRVYHKNGNSMSYYEREAGTMTYHPSHGHNHVDDWGVFTLRIDNGDPNPLNWPIVGQGQKMGFCLMDYGQCGASGYIGHCRDDNTVYNQGNTLINGDFPNWGLGGGQYNCSQVEQGISSGWTDVYGKHLDGMWINIPPGTCNGNYWIVVDIDPNQNFLEEDESNNYTAIPVTLTLQNSSNPVITISADQTPVICTGSNITLTATAGTAFLWNTGDTTQTITVSAAGTYTCDVTTYCGTGQATFTVYNASSAVPTAQGDTVCVNNSATLTASGAGTIRWRDASNNIVGTGNTFVTPSLSATTTYYAENVQSHTDSTFATPNNSNMGSGSFLTSAQYEIFTVYSTMTLLSVKVEAQAAGSRTIQLQDSAGNVLQTISASLPAGESRVALNWTITPGNDYRLVGTNGGAGLYRNNGGVSYPFDLPGVMRITNSSAGLAYYYYFYDWHIATTNESCVSTPVAAVATVETCTGIGEDTGFRNSISIAPNPNNGQFSLSFNAPRLADVNVVLTDLTGRVVYTEMISNANGRLNREMDFSALSKGTYFVTLQYEGNSYSSRMVLQ